MRAVPVYLERAAFLPEYASPGAAGMDVFAEETVGLMPGQTKLVSCGGLRVEIPEGFELQVRSRSGLAAKYGIIVLNAPGTIDSDYRGEIKVILHNIGFNSYIVKPGDRIAQLVLCPVERFKWFLLTSSNQLSQTERGEGGFGSTGT